MRLPLLRDRHVRCAWDVEGFPCGARPEVEAPRQEWPAVERHVLERHLRVSAEEFARRPDGHSEHVSGGTATLYRLADGRRWIFCGTDREWGDWTSRPEELRVTPAEEPVYAF